MPRMRATRNHYAPQLHSPCIYWGPFVCSTNRGPGDHPSDSIPSSTLSSFFYIPPCEQCRITDHPCEYPGPTIRALAEFTAWLAGREGRRLSVDALETRLWLHRAFGGGQEGPRPHRICPLRSQHGPDLRQTGPCVVSKPCNFFKLLYSSNP